MAKKLKYLEPLLKSSLKNPALIKGGGTIKGNPGETVVDDDVCF